MKVPVKAILFVFRSLVILIIKAYQILISPVFGNACRFSPTCSNYMIAAIEKKGIFLGVLKGVLRIFRCHPWGGSGYDPVN